MAASFASSIFPAFLTFSWMLDVGCGIFFIAASLSHFATITAVAGDNYATIALSLFLLIIGGVIFITGLLRFPAVDTYCKILHRFAGKSFFYLVGSAVILALEPQALKLSWRGIVAVIVSALAAIYALLSCATCNGGSNPRPLIYCGEPSKTEDAAPTTRTAGLRSPLRAGGHAFAPAPEASTLSNVVRQSATKKPTPAAKPPKYAENPFSIAAGSIV